MGQPQTKYHITDDGDIYKINEDGSFTSMGNAEQRDVSSQAKAGTNQHYKVVLESTGKQKLLVVKKITELTNYSLKPAKALVDYLPAVIIDDISEAEASQIKSEFERIGAIVSVQSHTFKPNGHTDIDNNSFNGNHSSKGSNRGCFGVFLMVIFTAVSFFVYFI